MDNPSIRKVILTAFWNPGPNDKDLEPDLVETVNALTAANKEVYINDDIPNFTIPAAKCRYKSRFGGLNTCHEESLIFLNPNVKIIKTSDFFCINSLCRMAKNSTFLYRDSNHLNILGSQLLGKKIIQDNPELAHPTSRKAQARKPLASFDRF